jgi:2-methylcitrate dehydratase PrpD
MERDNKTSSIVIDEVSSYVSKSREAKLPEEVIEKAKHHILDTLAAMVSGSRLKPGQLAKQYASAQAGTGLGEAQVVGSSLVTSAINAAFANGMMAHADETDDFNKNTVGTHIRSGVHPGCTAVPAALAMAEREGADGMRFLKAVVVGYDIGCRIYKAINLEMNLIVRTHFSTFGIGGNFAAAAAAAAVPRLDRDSVAYVLSYAGHQCSGQNYWVRDKEHVEKAFVFAGMPARNGVMAVLLMQSGFTGVSDPFSGERNFFEPFTAHAKPELLAEGLGTYFEIMHTNIKIYPIGGPTIAPVDGLLSLIEKNGIAAEDVASITVQVPESHSGPIGDDRNIPGINLPHLLAIALLDRGLTYESVHSYDRMKDPAVLKTRERVRWTRVSELNPCQSIVKVTTRDGTQFSERIEKLRGTSVNPLKKEDVEKKCRGLLAPVLGEDRSQKLIDTIWNLEKVSNISALRSLLSA